MKGIYDENGKEIERAAAIEILENSEIEFPMVNASPLLTITAWQTRDLQAMPLFALVRIYRWWPEGSDAFMVDNAGERIEYLPTAGQAITVAIQWMGQVSSDSILYYLMDTVGVESLTHKTSPRDHPDPNASPHLHHIAIAKLVGDDENTQLSSRIGGDWSIRGALLDLVERIHLYSTPKPLGES